MNAIFLNILCYSFSNFFNAFIKIGLQITDPYVILDRTREIYKVFITATFLKSTQFLVTLYQILLADVNILLI